mgnify:CR=1 FL=1
MSLRKNFLELINKSQSILVIQPDRPDGDSLASALALEEILSDFGKTVTLYCGVNIPEYLRFIDGWDRVNSTIDKTPDLTILVDDASKILLEKFENTPLFSSIISKPFVIIDHHQNVSTDIQYCTLNLTEPNYASAGELIYDIFKELKLKVSLTAKKLILQSILSDTMGLTNDLANASTYRLVADIIESGVSRTELEEARKAYSKMDESVFRYKASLIKRVEFYDNIQIGLCVIPESEAYDIGTLYNPGPLILGEMLMVKDLKVALAIKVYKNHVTVAIRCTYGSPVAHKLAESFGGGGHDYSAGFRVQPYDGNINNLKLNIVNKLKEILSKY